MVELKNIKTEISFVIWISDSDLIPKNQETVYNTAKNGIIKNEKPYFTMVCDAVNDTLHP